jgi:two-component system, LytTR family, sensor kinase
MDPILLSGDQFTLVSLLIQIGLMASLASMLTSSRFYQRFLLRDAPGPGAAAVFALSFGTCLAVGVGSRVLLGYSGLDLTLPGTLVAGVVGGPLAGLIAGLLAGGAATVRGEWLALPFAVTSGLLGGALGTLPGARVQRWEYSPYPYMNVYRLVRARRARDFVPTLLIVLCLGLDIGRTLLTFKFGTRRLWSIQPNNLVVLCAVWLTNLITLGVPLKIWNNTRLEKLLEEQERLAVRSRLDALTQQINPHFLFNTLNSVRAAIRVDPEMARDLIHKLSAILRRVLDTQKSFVSLAEELEYIDAYLDIEVARFGAEKLRIVKSVEPGVESALVPCMVVQPLVENAVLHAIGPRPEGGTVTIRVWREGTRVRVEIADDGPGFDATKLELGREPSGRSGRRRGIGLANVHQRLEMAYGQGLAIDTRRGAGTRIGFTVPFTPGRDLLEAVPGRDGTGADSHDHSHRARR